MTNLEKKLLAMLEKIERHLNSQVEESNGYHPSEAVLLEIQDTLEDAYEGTG